MLETRANRRETTFGGILPDIPWGTKNSTTPCVEGPERPSLISRLYPTFDARARAIQLWICEKMDEGLPPVRSIDAFGGVSE